MNFKFLIISVVILSGFAGSVFAQVPNTTNIQLTPQEFSQEEIDEMKQKAVIITVNSGTFFIEFFPEEAPNTVHNFLKLVESGYYDGTVFHRNNSAIVLICIKFLKYWMVGSSLPP